MKNQDDKEKLFNSVIEIFFSDGISVSMDEISSRLHISKKTLYKHFKNREDILDNIIHYVQGRARQVMEDAFSPEKDPFESLLGALIKLPEIFAILSKKFINDIRRYEPERWKKIDQFRINLFMKYFPSTFKKAQKMGYLRKDINLEILLLLYVSAIQGLINPEVLSRASFTPMEAVKNIVEIVFKGINTEKGRIKFEDIQKKFINKRSQFHEKPIFNPFE
jgi:TetR/AcrR family transcriptional regulator, cholesterol catabolism regulator